MFYDIINHQLQLFCFTTSSQVALFSFIFDCFRAWYKRLLIAASHQYLLDCIKKVFLSALAFSSIQDSQKLYFLTLIFKILTWSSSDCFSPMATWRYFNHKLLTFLISQATLRFNFHMDLGQVFATEIIMENWWLLKK